MTNLWYRIQNEIQRNPQKTLECANLCAKAYADATGHEEWYKEITDPTSLEYKQNMTGLLAALACIPLLAMYAGQSNPYSDEAVYAILPSLCVLDTTSHMEEKIQHLPYALPAHFANTLWNLVKVFMDRQSDRCNNFPILFDIEFNQHLPQAQGIIELDILQVVTAARWLAAQLGISFE